MPLSSSGPPNRAEPPNRADSAAVIKVEGVSHSYPGRRPPVLTDLNLQLTERRIGVIGANGSGKSTFARLLNGLVLPSLGRVSIAGHDTRRDGAQVRRLVGFCFTDPDAQIVMPTVAEDVAFSLRGRRSGPGARHKTGRALLREHALAELDRFGLIEFADQPAHLLSGGQKQLLALAAVLVTEPRVLVLDEPTTLLDLQNSEMIAEVIDSQDLQVVLLTHHLELLEGYDRVLVFDAGRVVFDAAPGPAIDRYRKLVRNRMRPKS